MKKTSLALSACMILSMPAFAQSFDFETTAPGFYAPSLVVSNGGQTLTITTEGVNGFVNVDAQFVPVPLGNRSVIGSLVNPLSFGQFAPLRFSFAMPVEFITFAFGDAGGDNDSPVVIKAYNAGGTLLDTVNETFPQNLNGAKTASMSLPTGASYFTLESFGGASNDYSLFWEVTESRPFRGTDVPEPSSLAMLGAGLLTAGMVSRRLRKRT